MYNFMKQNYIEVERGIEYMNYQREVFILTDFWQKTAKRSKNEEINRKKGQKLTKKSRNMCQFFIWNAIAGYAKYCAINFRGFWGPALQKTKFQAKKLGHLDEKRLKTVIYMCHSVKNYFSMSKSHSLNAAHDQKTSLAQKKLVHTAILLAFAFRSKHRLNE